MSWEYEPITLAFVLCLGGGGGIRTCPALLVMEILLGDRERVVGAFLLSKPGHAEASSAEQ